MLRCAGADHCKSTIPIVLRPWTHVSTSVYKADGDIEYAHGADETPHARNQSRRRKPMQTISVLLVLGLSAVAMTTPAVGGYRLLQTISVAGDDGWDHPTVDSAARRLYVTHGTHVVVIDVDSGKLVGKIDNTPGVHFTVIDQELDRGFISNGGAARLTIFNANTLETIGQVKSTGENPGPTVFDPATKRVFTFNLNSHNATVVDSKEGNVVGAFDLGGRPELVGTDGKGNVLQTWYRKTSSCRSIPER
jgi:DNA-binding beta-propeller fold protein YncE